jgi:hypothetical protein
MYMLAKLLHYSEYIGVVIDRIHIVSAGGAGCDSIALTQWNSYSSVLPVDVWEDLDLPSCLFEIFVGCFESRPCFSAVSGLFRQLLSALLSL